MKTSLLLAALLSLGAAAAFAADAPAVNPPAAPAANGHQAECEKIDADLTKVYATHKGLFASLKAHSLLSHRKALKCPGNPPAPPAKK